MNPTAWDIWYSSETPFFKETIEKIEKQGFNVVQVSQEVFDEKEKEPLSLRFWSDLFNAMYVPKEGFEPILKRYGLVRGEEECLK
jgi:hypothetical protein